METRLYCIAAATTSTPFSDAASSRFPILSTKHPTVYCPKVKGFATKATSYNPSYPILCFSSTIPKAVAAEATSTSPLPSTDNNRRHWMVHMETPPRQFVTKPQVIDYYVTTLEKVISCKEDAQKCIYDATWDIHFGFCCDIDVETANELAGMPGVLFVKPDPDFDSMQKDYSYFKNDLNSPFNQCNGSTLLFPLGTTKHWLIRMDRPAVGAMRKASIVDYYTQVLMRVLGSEEDAQMCIYHVSWQSNYGFCCELDDECAQELAGVPGVLSVQPDANLESDNKDYGGESSVFKDSPALVMPNHIKTRKLFVTGLSFYTSEKTLSAAFEGFGELVEVKIIMDKISKRSKGYAFIEYTTEEAASTALREMNGQIINGWMITVDVAKNSPPKYVKGFSRTTF